MPDARDELRHPAGAGELWNESYYFNFYDGERRIGGFTRIGLQDNLELSNVWCLLIKGGRPSYQRFLLNLPRADGDLDTGITAGGLTYRMRAPFERFRIEFRDRDTELDLLWEAVHPVQVLGERLESRSTRAQASFARRYRAKGARRRPKTKSWVSLLGETGEGLPEEMASHHYEQSGQVTGRFALKGERLELRGTGSRDHSWGIRDWGALRGWMGAWPVFGRDLLFTCGRITLADGSVRELGFVSDGRENRQIERSRLQARLGRDGLTVEGVRLDLTDETGRRIRAEGRVIANFPLPYDGSILNEAMFEYRTEDRVGYGLFEYYVTP